MKLPSFQFYPGDHRKDPGVQALNFHDRGVWLELLCLMHESDERGVLLLNGKPMPEDALARVLGLDKQILTTTINTLLTFGVASRRELDGALFSRRMVRDENLRKVRSEAGKLGGNPVLLKQNDKQNPTTRLKQNPTPSSSSSSSDLRKHSAHSRSARSDKRTGFYTDEFESFWHHSPRGGSKAEAFKVWGRMTIVDRKAAAEAIPDHVSAWRQAGTEPRYIPHVVRWLRGRRWESPPAQSAGHGRSEPLYQRPAETYPAPGDKPPGWNADEAKQLIEELRKQREEQEPKPIEATK